METAKLFRHGGSQAVRLPKAFRFEGTEVVIERRGEEVVLKPNRKPKLKTLADVARYMHERYPQGADFPDIERPKKQQKRVILLWLAGGASQLETWDPKPGAPTGGRATRMALPSRCERERRAIPDGPRGNPA